jgi:hypothetical protein
VEDVHVEPAAVPGRVRVEARLVNAGRGQGQVEVTVRLRDRRTGRVVEDERHVELRGHESVRLVADVEAPPGDYHADVEAEYPPM